MSFELSYAFPSIVRHFQWDICSKWVENVTRCSKTFTQIHATTSLNQTTFIIRSQSLILLNSDRRIGRGIDWSQRKSRIIIESLNVWRLSPLVWDNGKRRQTNWNSNSLNTTFEMRRKTRKTNKKKKIVTVYWHECTAHRNWLLFIALFLTFDECLKS